MARIAVVSYPILDRADFDWIESIRSQHDPQAGRIAPHFTLVFPLDAPADITREIAGVTARQTPITFVIRSAVAMPDVVRGGAHVFLVPDDGRDQITRLHGELYVGSLRPHLREDVTFIPHITVAAHDDLRWCQAYVEQLTETLPPVRGVIESLTLLDVTAAKIEPLAEFRLASPNQNLFGSKRL